MNARWLLIPGLPYPRVIKVRLSAVGEGAHRPQGGWRRRRCADDHFQVGLLPRFTAGVIAVGALAERVQRYAVVGLAIDPGLYLGGQVDRNPDICAAWVGIMASTIGPFCHPSNPRWRRFRSSRRCSDGCRPALRGAPDIKPGRRRQDRCLGRDRRQIIAVHRSFDDPPS